ncbi:hypothetical protein BJV77DRAFT_959782 [Russula vinacea]|nr:hypothetical protein BJV77DRAFT_959782 [Russula vinacea]
MPLPPAPFHNTSRISQDLLRYLVRRHGVKSETALSPQQSLHPPYQSTPVHVTSHKPDDLLTLSPDILPNCYKVLFCVLLNIESHVPSPNDDDDGTGPNEGLDINSKPHDENLVQGHRQERKYLGKYSRKWWRSETCTWGKTTWAEIRERDITAGRLGGLRFRVLRVSGPEEPGTLRGDVVEMIRQLVFFAWDPMASHWTHGALWSSLTKLASPCSPHRTFKARFKVKETGIQGTFASLPFYLEHWADAVVVELGG